MENLSPIHEYTGKANSLHNLFVPNIKPKIRQKLFRTEIWAKRIQGIDLFSVGGVG